MHRHLASLPHNRLAPPSPDERVSLFQDKHGYTDARMKVISITGYKGGVAKSTTAIHLATFLVS